MPFARGLHRIALVVILALSVVPARAQSDWERFTHPTVGFSLSYPPGWVPQTASNPNLHLILIGPSAARVPDFPMGVIVISVPAPPNATAERVFDGAEPLREQVGNARILRVDRTKLNGISAAVIYATSYVRGTDLYIMVLLTIAKSRGYMVVGVTALDSSQLAAETRQLQAILASFRLGQGSLDEHAVAPPELGQWVDGVQN